LPLPLYYERLETLISWLEASGDAGMVRSPGARRWSAWLENTARGIALDVPTSESLRKLCQEYGLRLPQALGALAA
jgi:LDH2 family malate/lactate/ureidoglycolate dehydrogenase